MEDWYHISPAQIEQLGGAGLRRTRSSFSELDVMLVKFSFDVLMISNPLIFLRLMASWGV